MIANATVIEHCRTIAGFSDEGGAITRTFLGQAMRDCLAYFTNWATHIGLSQVRVDAAGNFRALLPGRSSRRLVVGSHLDSVPHAGAFDGVLGVVMGMKLAELFHDSVAACSVEIVGFSEEEGVRFGRPFIGSRAFVEGLNDETLNLADGSGIKVREAILNFGLDASSSTRPLMEPADGYLEFHIEQGPVLESLGLPIGIVDAIVGQTRASVEFIGKANHAGTTPMNLRRDAFAAAAEWALFVESKAQSTPGLVATAGSVRVSPDVVNVVPGRAVLSLDLRHAQDEVRARALDEILNEAHSVATRRQVEARSSIRMSQRAVPMNHDLVALAAKSVADCGIAQHHMTSGAGHDAMILAEHIPSAMIFLRSPGGISHHPDENVLAEDVELALAVGRAFIRNFA